MLDLMITLVSGCTGGLLLALLPERHRRLRPPLVLLSAGLSLIFGWRLALAIFGGSRIRLAGQLAGFTWSLDPDPLSAVFGLIVSTLWVFAAVYSLGYMKNKPRQKTYYTFFLMSLTVTLGVAYSGNLMVLYVFYELLTLVTYPLVVHEGGPKTVRAGKQYILYSLSGAGVLLLALVLTFSRVGAAPFRDGPLLAGSSGPGLNLLLGLFVLGFGVKAALMPLHRWLPEAMVAPTPVSALLHAVAVVYSGVYGIMRTVYSVFGPDLMKTLPLSAVLPWLAVVTLITGVVLATRQDVLKKRLAYHTISQLSYILLGVFLLQPWGLTGAVLHLISYSMLKMALFFCAGIISEQTGETLVSRMTGVGRSLPRTLVAFAVASLGMIGMLPLSTFWSKYFLMSGGVRSGGWVFALSLVISGMVNAVCFLPTVVAGFQGEPRPSVERGGGLLWMLVPTLLLVLAAVSIGLVPGLVWPGVQAVVHQFFS